MNGEIPAELAELCTELLQKEPKNRPQSAQAVANKLSLITQETATKTSNNQLFLYVAEHQLIDTLLESKAPTIVTMADTYPSSLTKRVLLDLQLERTDNIHTYTEAPTPAIEHETILLMSCAILKTRTRGARPSAGL